MALRFLIIAVVIVVAVSLISWGLARVFGRQSTDTFTFPLPFIASTSLLLWGSLVIHSALMAVRRERLVLFRHRLLRSLVAATLFVGVQTYALWSIAPEDRSLAAASAGVAPFFIMLAFLHVLHFLVATLFVSYITASAWSGRYDHEYHWGVTVCAWFWHALGAVWLAVLAIAVIAAGH